jgi:hypothetical protein
MRVLVAGRNAKVLAKAAGTFVHDLEIRTAGTKAACFALLQQVEFDLIVACETLSDGSGLEVLSHVAVNTPNTLRIFAARPATLNLLKGELGLFGLFRTLPYPINFQKLWAAINLARSTCVEPARTAPPAPRAQDVVLEETWDGSEVDVVAVAPKQPAPAAAASAVQPRRSQQTADRLRVTSATRVSLAPTTAASAAVRSTTAPPREQSQLTHLSHIEAAQQYSFDDVRVTATSARGRKQHAQPSPTGVPTRGASATTAARRSESGSQSPAATPQRGAAASARRQAQSAPALQGTSVTAARGPAATARRHSQPAQGQHATGATGARTTAAAARRQGQPAARQKEITSGMRAAARYAAAHAGRDASAKQTRIPESDAFKRARARRDAGRVEPILNTESLAQLAKAALTKRPPPQYRSAPAGKKRAAWYVGSGVFAATTAAVLTFFMVNANNSIKQPKLPMMASITQPVSNKVFPWQPETQQPTGQAAFMRSEAPASTVADIQAEAEAASESADGDPDHPGPPPPYSPPPPSEPPSLEAPGQWVDE